MSTYLARVELHGAQSDDYEPLHQYMRSIGFERTMPHGDGSLNQLPDGTYISGSGGDLTKIREQISSYADHLTVRRASVFVCQFDQCSWYLYRAES